jgi:hypothetical protein
MKRSIVLLLLAFSLLAMLAYGIPRTDFLAFLAAYTGLFALYGYWMYTAPQTFKAQHWLYYLGAALLLRLMFGAALPELSDDFWRYLWDGRLLSHGVNPYQFVPSELLGQPLYEQANLAQLYPQLNSPNYHSVYPPLAQMLFATATYFFPENVAGSVLLLRLLVVALEMGTVVLLYRYLQHNNRPLYWAFVYAYNPLIILELSGNLHTESLMLFFLSLLLYYWTKAQYGRAALACALAVAAKLLPLMLLPLFCWRLLTKPNKKGSGWRLNWTGVRAAVVFGAIVGMVNLCLFALFYDWALVQKIRTSMALYFQHFEFNGSVYYFLRYQVLHEYWRLWDYHTYFMDIKCIEDALRLDWYVVLRRVLPVLTLLGILGVSLRHRSTASVADSCLWIFGLYFFMGTTVHPWYINSLVLFSVLGTYRFPLVWSALVGATYISYQSGGFEEQTWVIILEYGVVWGVLCWELYQNKAPEQYFRVTNLQKK